MVVRRRVVNALILAAKQKRLMRLAAEQIYVSADGNVLNNGINGISYGILGKGPAVHPAFHLFKTTVGRSINFHKIATYGKWEGSFPIFMQTVKPSVLFDFHNGNGKK